MKFDPQKAYPYPVLRPFSDDFGEVEFQTAIESCLEDKKSVLTAKIEFIVSSSDILEEINSRRAAYCVVFSCRNTYFRKPFFSRNNVMDVELDLGSLRDEVTVEPYIVAIKDICAFKSNDIDSEFGEGTFKYERGYILAQDEHQSFFIDRDVFKPVTSVFDLVKKDNLPEGEWIVSFDQDHVQIGVSSSMKEKIDNARNNVSNKAILINSVYFGATMQAVQHLKDGQDFDGYKWAIVIRRQAHNMGIDLVSCQAYEATERLMKFPLALLSMYVFKGE